MGEITFCKGARSDGCVRFEHMNGKKEVQASVGAGVLLHAKRRTVC